MNLIPALVIGPRVLAIYLFSCTFKLKLVLRKLKRKRKTQTKKIVLQHEVFKTDGKTFQKSFLSVQ